MRGARSAGCRPGAASTTSPALPPVPLIAPPVSAPPMLLSLGDSLLRLWRDGHAGQLGEPQPLVADRRPERIVRPPFGPRGTGFNSS